MKKQYFFITISIFLGLNLYAQKNSSSNNQNDVVTYKLISDNVDVNLVKLKLSLWELDLNDYNFSIYDFKIEPLLLLGNGKFLLSAEYGYGLGDRILPDAADGDQYLRQDAVFSIYESTHSSYGQLTGTIYLYQKKEEKMLKVFFKSVYAGFNTTVNYYSNIQGTLMRKVGLRLGYKQGYTWYAMNDKTIYGVPFSSSSSNPKEINFAHMSDMMKYSHLNFGVCYSTLANLKVNFTQYGDRKRSYLDAYYFDFIIAVKQKLDDVYVASDYNPNTDKIYILDQYNIDDSTPKAKLGFALGYRDLPASGSSLLSKSFEFGYYPGIKNGSNIYLKIGVSAWIGIKG